MKPRLTILIPTYNRGYLIKSTIENCYSQSYKNFNILIYDDGSDDNTSDIIKNLKLKYSNITYVNGRKNMGIGYARNFLLSNMNTEFGMWLDSDDLMKDDRIEKCISYMDKNPQVKIVYSNIQWFNSINGEINLKNNICIDVNKYDKNSWQSLKYNTACATGFFRESLKKFKFEESLRLGGEDVLWVWDLLQHNIKIGHINESLYFYRNHKNRIGREKRENGNIEMKAIEDSILAEKIKQISKLSIKDE